MRSADIHAALGSGWANVLAQLGVPETALCNKHGPCPACGGKDRFRFDNKRGRGDYICSRCGAGDGFNLLQIVHGWDFAETRKRVMAAAGLTAGNHERIVAAPAPVQPDPPAKPTSRIHKLRSTTCAVENSSDAVFYLDSRQLWPLPEGCTLRAHASADYYENKQLIGRFPALIADVVDLAGSLVSVHVTYLQEGRKLEGHAPRKILSPLTSREGCAVRLMPAGETLGIAEGIETALSAFALEGVPTWAALNTSLLAKFEPPSGVSDLVIFADRDEAGLDAACKLMERMQGRIRFTYRPPPPPKKDWNDVLTSKHEGRFREN